MAFVLFSAMRNEGPFLLDWIAYHRAIGFDKVVIVSNNCDDGSNALLARLAENDIIIHFDQIVQPGLSPQASAVAQVERMGILQDGDWGVFLDADEYLNIHVGAGCVADLAQAVEQAGAIGMLVPWRLFGDSGHPRFPGSYIRPDYTNCQEQPPKVQFKTFFRKGPVADGFSAWLHRCRLRPGIGQASDFLTGGGAPIATSGPTKLAKRHSRWLLTGEEGYSQLTGPEVDYTLAQINHYIVRDPHSFALKKKRGRGHVLRKLRNRRHTADFYQANNHNAAVDDTIVRWQAKVESEKAKLIATCDLSSTLAEIEGIYVNASSMTKTTVTETAVGRTVFPLTFPDDVSEYVRDQYARAEAILEYGSGGSTQLACELGVPCVAVESDKNWAAALTSHLDAQFGLAVSAKVVHVDIGATKEWGFPIDASRWSHFWRYPMQVWQDDPKPAPTLILIDGRMRKACFAAALLNVTRETTVLFDDYAARRHYHEVEEYVKPTRLVGRMAEFVITPGIVDQSAFQKLVPWFFDLR